MWKCDKCTYGEDCFDYDCEQRVSEQRKKDVEEALNQKYMNAGMVNTTTASKMTRAVKWGDEIFRKNWE